MITIVISVVLGLFGLVFGSFAGATVWRIRARQLRDDASEGETVDKKEFRKLSPLTTRTLSSDRSMCLECGHTLRWYDLLPIVSWVSTGGKCRYCKKSIGYFEPVMEILTAVLFVTAYLALAPSTTVGIISFVLTLTMIVMLVVLAAYDLKWFLLPDVVVFPFIAVAAAYAALHIFSSGDVLSTVLQTILSVVIFSGTYYLLYQYSKHAYGEERTWVGFGDVKLNLGLGLVLGSWSAAFVALFLANFIGVLVVLPLLLTKKTALKAQIPFGPLLIIGFFITFFFGEEIITGYLQFNTIVAGWLATLML